MSSVKIAGVEPCSEVVIDLLYFLYPWEAEVIVQLALDQRPRARDRTYAVIKDNF